MKRRTFLRAAAASAVAACGAPTPATSLAREKPVVVVALRGPYDILSVPEIAAYLCAYDSREPSLTAAAEVLLGERKPAGSLPAVVPGIFGIGAGMRDFA